MFNSNNCLQNNREKIKKNILQYRLSCLCGMAVVGIIIAICFYKWGACALGLSTDDWITKNLTLLILSLPVLVLLWYFRTHDVKQQIEKAQSNININLLNNGINLLLNGEGGNKPAAGLILLAQLRQQDEQLHPQIDAITQGVALEKVKLRNAKLQGINLRDANLQGINLQIANLQGAQLQFAELQKANLQVANLQGAQLQGAQLQGAQLQGAYLYGAQLQGANLQGANLQGAYSQGADLQGAYLQGADLQDAYLQGADLQGAFYGSNTKFSAGFDPETKGMQKVD